MTAPVSLAVFSQIDQWVAENSFSHSEAVLRLIDRAFGHKRSVSKGSPRRVSRCLG
jgi:hypothetical protein